MRREVRSAGRILVVEDEALIALMIEDAVADLGCEVVGPTGKLETALRLVAEEMLDAAILDVSIRGQKVYPVADQLSERGIPFILASGYGDWALPENLRDQPRLTKPFTGEELKYQLKKLLEQMTRYHKA